MKIVKEKVLYKGSLIIEEATIQSPEDLFKRERLNRPDAVAVLLLNTDTNKIILTRQFRYAIAEKSKENILEVLAGKIEINDSPEETAVRETLEETGYKLKKKNLRFLVSCFASPGYSSEKFHVYFATATNADKISEGGGLKEENEHIGIVEVPREIFERMVLEGAIEDAKTYIAGLFFIQNPC